MMSVRGLSYEMKCREAPYYAFEAKWFSEQSPGVGIKTDVYVMRAGHDAIKLDLDTSIEKKLVEVCNQMNIRDLDKKHEGAIKILNGIEELGDFEKIEPKKKE
jgi:hypothetical protein